MARKAVVNVNPAMAVELNVQTTRTSMRGEQQPCHSTDRPRASHSADPASCPPASRRRTRASRRPTTAVAAARALRSTRTRTTITRLATLASARPRSGPTRTAARRRPTTAAPLARRRMSSCPSGCSPALQLRWLSCSVTVSDCSTPWVMRSFLASLALVSLALRRGAKGSRIPLRRFLRERHV